MIAERIGKEYGSEYQRHNEDCWYATHLKYTNLSDDFPKKPSTIPCVEGLRVGIYAAHVPNRFPQRRIQGIPLGLTSRCPFHSPLAPLL